MSSAHTEETQYEDSALPQLELRNHLLDSCVSERYETYRLKIWKFHYFRGIQSEEITQSIEYFCILVF